MYTAKWYGNDGIAEGTAENEDVAALLKEVEKQAIVNTASGYKYGYEVKNEAGRVIVKVDKRKKERT